MHTQLRELRLVITAGGGGVFNKKELLWLACHTESGGHHGFPDEKAESSDA